MNKLIRLLTAIFAGTCISAQAASYNTNLPAVGSLNGLGVNIHFTSPLPGEMQAIAAAGFKYVRMDLTWANTETRKGVYNFSAYDTLVSSATAAGLKILFIMDYGNPLYAKAGDTNPYTSEANTAAFRTAYSNWFVAAVKRYQGKGFVWEIWNEPDQPYAWAPEGNASQYASLALAAAQALTTAGLINSNNTGECLIGPAVSSIDIPFIETCLKAGMATYWSAVSVHPYRQIPPETTQDCFRDLRVLISRYAPAGKTIPVIASEWGYSTTWFPVDDLNTQAKYVSRIFLSNIASNIPLSIWYDWVDDCSNTTDQECWFGLTDAVTSGSGTTFQPKPSYVAAQALTSQLAGYTFNKRFVAGDDYQYALLFSSGSNMKIVSWQADSPGAVISSTLAASTGQFNAWNFLGATTTAPTVGTTNGLTYLALSQSDSPTYIQPVGGNNILNVGSAWQPLPLDILVSATTSATITNTISNPLSQPLVLSGTTVQSGSGVTSSFSFPGTRVPKTPWQYSLVSPGFCTFTQESVVCSQNGVVVTPLTLLGATLPVEVDNASGLAFSGTLVFTTGTYPPGISGSATALQSKNSQTAVSFKSGSTTQIVAVPLVSQPASFYKTGLSLSVNGTPALSGTALAVLWDDFTKYANTTKPTAYSLVSDGSSSVKSSASIAVVTAPSGLSASGQKAISLTYSTNPGWKFWRVTPKTTTITGQPTEYGVWVYGDAKYCSLQARFVDSTGQTFQISGPIISWTGWQYITMPMVQDPTHEAIPYWGGAGDGAIHYPIYWDTILLLNNYLENSNSGKIYFTDPGLNYL